MPIIAGLAGLPYQTIAVNEESLLSPAFEGYLKSVDNNINSLRNRGFQCFLRNPDFNLLSANGTAIVTQAQGSNYEFVDKWFVVNGGGLNDYAIAPNAYLTISNSPSGSNYYLNVIVGAQSTPLYFYNLNYSTTNQFDSVGKFSGKVVTLSIVLINNLTNLPQVNFSAYINGIDEIQSGAVFIQPGTNTVSTTFSIPDLTGDSYPSSPFIQFRLNILDIDGGMDCNIGYIKGEIANFSSILDLDHIQEQLICNALT